MSEYWVSHKKYLCKYCNIYIADDVPSRRQHESGLKHKGSVERFVRGLYKEGAKRKQDQEEEKRDMTRIEQAARAAYASDVSAGHARGDSGSAIERAPVAGPSKPVPRPSNPYANYSTAESLGYTDPDAERRKAEAERRQTAGVAGDWEVVAIVEPSAAAAEEEEVYSHELPAPVALQAEEAQKRPAEHDPEDTRLFKLRKKTASVGLGQIYDPGVIPIKLKKKEEPEEPSLALEQVASILQHSPLPGASGASSKPKWSARGWRRPGEEAPEEAEDQAVQAETSFLAEAGGNIEVAESAKTEAKPEDPPTIPLDTLGSAEVKQENPEVKSEDAVVKIEGDASASAPSGGSLFRKRKLPTGRGRK